MPFTVTKSEGVTCSSSFSGEKNFVFFYDNEKRLAYYAGQDDGDSWDQKVIVINGETITANTSFPAVASVAYEFNGKKEIRVYYVDGAQKRIKEICKTDNLPWFKGALSERNYVMDVPGLLTAAADRNTGVLKVFYVSSNELNIVTSAFGGGQWPPAPKPVI